MRELSLRELARDIGVSHSAPRRHFPDKDALLAGLAEEGFRRLGRDIDAALGDATDDFEARLLAFARAYVSFAVEHGALLDLMFARKHEPGAVGLQQASEQAFAAPQEILSDAQRDGEIVEGDLTTLGMTVVSALHGLAALTGAGLLEAGAVGALVDDLVHRLLLGLRPR